MRLFFSVDLPPSLAAEVAAVQRRFADAPGLRSTDPAQAHVTLQFLGDVEPDHLDEIETAAITAVADADVAPFRVEIGGLGAFPGPEYISVVWLGVDDGSAELTRLHRALEESMIELGFDPDPHEFTPHVTIARMNDARGKALVQRRLREDDPTVGSFDVTAVHLTESVLTDDGPQYGTVARIPL